MPPLNEINQLAEDYSKKYGHTIHVIEDAAQSFGATFCGKRSGSLTEIATTSFFPAKPLGCYGDGGAIFTNDDVLAGKMRMLLNHGQRENRITSYNVCYTKLLRRCGELECARRKRAWN